MIGEPADFNAHRVAKLRRRVERAFRWRRDLENDAAEYVGCIEGLRKHAREPGIDPERAREAFAIADKLDAQDAANIATATARLDAARAELDASLEPVIRKSAFVESGA